MERRLLIKPEILTHALNRILAIWMFVLVVSEGSTATEVKRPPEVVVEFALSTRAFLTLR